MQQRTAILLIGVILAVGFLVVGGIGIADVSASDTLFDDGDGAAEDGSIQAQIEIDYLSVSDTIKPSETPELPETETDERGPEEGTQWNVTVTRVIDGDTIEAEFPNGDRETLRLLGVDTPETTLQSVSPDEFEGVPETTEGRDHLFDWGEKSTDFTTQTLANTQITVEVDEQADRRGYFGRLLVFAYADTDSVSDGDSFNRQLLTQGYARLYESDFSREASFESVEDQAQQNNTQSITLGLSESVCLGRV